ncbi:unnamed protein product [Kuraishia capsulata CBS 1993]|uniref:Major facilitator superfamily (MFS) profile domain-containing protein n=1 Tax=Kuraishia capsulata CBS 1993 TaxID=1382522 RepID=W6MY45_9ASCO|nr:uncharacterized protein KUCA_T00005990001 [Kuraishia capsulata CBS 1993]CDK29995.1 unnamed protein product [Kuraishia capsulata CBS 1993]
MSSLNEAVSHISHDGEIHHPHKPNFSSASIKRYIVTRFTDLLPPKGHFQANKHLLNPLPPLKLIPGRQWLMILAALWGWTWDAYDFFSVSLNASKLAEDFDKSVKDITWGITLVLMLRSVGGFIFGYLGDKYGRKWPFTINLLLMCILEIGTGFIKNYKQFLGVRAVFGILLGGIYGNAAATALDDCPVEARGIISGILQQGYALGYLLAVVFTRAIADTTDKSWRAMFWFGAGVCFLIVVFRSLLPETEFFKQKKQLEQYNVENNISQPTFKEKAVASLKIYWLMIIYMVFLMAGFNFMSHGSQDLYPTLLTKQYSFSADRSTVTNCVANLGAITGGIFVGHMSQFVGRRLSIIVCCIGGGALIYPWAFVNNSAINAGCFFLQFFVQGAWGVVPVHLSELSPPEFRAFIVGAAYQLGNLASSASSTIETTIGERFPLQSKTGDQIYNYALVMSIFIGCVFGYVLLIVLAGPENRNANLKVESAANEFEKEVESLSDEENYDPRVESSESQNKTQAEYLERA